MPELILDAAGGGGGFEDAFVQRTTDPVILPSPVGTPADFAAQYATPLDTTEIVAMCEELRAWNAIPEQETMLQAYLWRELNSLAFTSGTNAISFADGDCPEEYTHNGSNTTTTLKNIGAKKSLTESDIKHSMGSIGAGYGVSRLVGGFDGSYGLPGGQPTEYGSFQQQAVASLKEKEMRLQATLVLNAWDRLLINGNAGSRPLEFSGIETLVITGSGAHGNYSTLTGAYSASTFDRYLAEACAKPTAIFGHPQAAQEMMSGYFALGFNGSQVIQYSGSGQRLTPGFNFGGEVNTSVGTLAVVADTNFTRTNTGGSTFQSSLFPLRMTHNGVPLVYRLNQFPLSFKDLLPGCTAISFQIWAKTALIIKHMCAHGRFTSIFNGNAITTCTAIG